ncbi:hypothetical protein AVEN_116626-1 [Araneus ventricosus]|uniref:Uncharacterized protein n=1 Tax=Araneus ventricosus TaxID=182803 RepID=A0A4Y2DGK6_ARAVE|nr:hypothetical protein AVEN_116626-1 [Araneus ventricosus]
MADRNSDFETMDSVEDPEGYAKIQAIVARCYSLMDLSKRLYTAESLMGQWLKRLQEKKAKIRDDNIPEIQGVEGEIQKLDAKITEIIEEANPISQCLHPSLDDTIPLKLDIHERSVPHHLKPVVPKPVVNAKILDFHLVRFLFGAVGHKTEIRSWVRESKSHKSENHKLGEGEVAPLGHDSLSRESWTGGADLKAGGGAGTVPLGDSQISILVCCKVTAILLCKSASLQQV